MLNALHVPLSVQQSVFLVLAVVAVFFHALVFIMYLPVAQLIPVMPPHLRGSGSQHVVLAQLAVSVRQSVLVTLGLIFWPAGHATPESPHFALVRLQQTVFWLPVVNCVFFHAFETVVYLYLSAAQVIPVLPPHLRGSFSQQSPHVAAELTAEVLQ